MANIAGSKDDGRAGKLAPGSKVDEAQAPRDVAIPSSLSERSDAEPLKTNSLAFKSDAPRQTSDFSVLPRIPPVVLRPFPPFELSALRMPDQKANMANIADSKDDGRAGKFAPGSKVDEAQAPPKARSIQTREIAEPPQLLKANDTMAFRSGAPRDSAMPSSVTRGSDAPIQNVSLAFKSDAPHQTRDAAMLSDVSPRIPPEALRPLTPFDLSTLHAAATRSTPVPKASFFRRVWQRLGGMFGLTGSR